VVVVLGLDEGDGDVRFVVEDVIGALCLAARDQFSANDDPALGEGDLLADLGPVVPASPLDCGGDELGADVTLGERFLHPTRNPSG